MPATADKLARTGEIQWVPVEKMRVSPTAQRELRPNFVDYLMSEFDPDQIGYPLVSHRDGWYYIVDGQHRIAAVRGMGWGDQMVECEVREGLSEQDEADLFLRRNSTLKVNNYEKFAVAVVAGREAECEIEKVCLANGYYTPAAGRTTSVSFSGADSVQVLRCVVALRKIYDAGGAPLLDRTLRFINAAFVSDNQGNIIKGVGLLIERFGDHLDDQVAAERLGKVRGGSRGLIQQANGLKRATGRSMAECVAAAATQVINGGRGGKRMLPNWWT